MAYLYDKDLEFLKNMKSEDLNDLVYLLIYDPKDECERISQELKNHVHYKLHYPNHSKYWKAIAEELQLYGGNTIANIIRGHGVLYREIVEDLLKKFKIKYHKTASIIELEQLFLEGILKQTLKKMSVKDKKELLQTLQKELKLQNFKENFQPSTENILKLSKTIFKSGGFKSYQLTVIIANGVSKAILGKGISFVGNATLTKSMSLLMGPIGMAIQGIWEIHKISGPAYRVTLPAVAEIALLRQLEKRRKEEEKRKKEEEIKRKKEEEIKRKKIKKLYFNIFLFIISFLIIMFVMYKLKFLIE